MMKSLFIALGARLTLGFPADLREPRAVIPEIGLTNITQVSFNDLRGRSLSGPFMGVNFPDPSVIWGDGSWKAYATSSNGKYVPVATSSDTFSWTLTGNDALPNVGSWVDPRNTAIWAPDVQKNDAGVYVMYYTAQQNGGSHCIGVATSTTAIGPFTPTNSPLLCDTAGGGVIDPSGYDDGVDRWILWKVDGNSLGGATSCQSGTPSGSYKPTPIKIQRVARDATTLLDSAKTILDNQGQSNDGIVEAPALYKVADGNYVLFYSAHCYSSDDYDIEYAWSSTIDGAYANRGILIRTVDNKGVFAPGGLDIDPNGKNVVFHGRLAANQGGSGSRELYSAVLSISGRSVSY
ncbi:glycoside hydrolase family 43 protein [Xylariomycetidae sp. FL2044]|nr:glycoside hydrolase family 43 protein [Xylariomycetidae sp. FL2044]